MVKHPFANKRLFSRIRLNQDDVISSESDVEEIGNRVLRRTPGRLTRHGYQGYFTTPGFSMQFLLPSRHPKTISRDVFTSSISGNAENGTISELSIRFPAIKRGDVEHDNLVDFIDDISDDSYRIRVPIQERVEGPEPEYHPHIHYSTKRRGIEKGPPIREEATVINKTIINWYSESSVLFK